MATTKTTPPSKLERRHVNVGLHQVYPKLDEAPSSRSSKKTNLDIIAIPGLGANPQWTWTWKHPQDEKQNVHWLEDSKMLPLKVPDARISVFQYESQWFGKGAVDQQLDNVVDQLLAGLHNTRGENSKTPIMFVCHCLGGIILERALLKARLRQDVYPTIFPSVAGCVFLGTPFTGTKSQSKAKILATMAETVSKGISSGLMKLLEENSEVLKAMVDDFARLSREAQIRLFCFFESHKSDLIRQVQKGLPFHWEEMIVEKSSATFTGVDSLQLNADHFGLNKYHGPDDPNFGWVSNEIKTIAKKAPGIIKTRQNALRQALVNDRTYHALIDTLGKGFSDLDATTRGSYKGPKGNKLSWVAKVDNFKQWKEAQAPRVLWIHGKAGTGQGAIASSIIDKFRGTNEPSEQAAPESIVASFFCDQSDEKRRSLSHMLRIIVRQVIDLDQNLAVHLLTDSKKGRNAGKQDFQPDEMTKAPFLWNALQAMAKDLPEGYITIVLYGLDQLSKDSLTTFLKYIEDVPSKDAKTDDNDELSPIKWMILSRSGRADIEKAFKTKAYEIDINDSENSAHVSDDLRNDISIRVDDLGLSAPLTYFVKRHIHSRAEDNYIYLSLAIQELKNAQSSGITEHAAIRAMLESFPSGLADMYDHIRERVLSVGAKGIEYTKEILRCMILAQRAPTMRELAIMADLPREDRGDLEKIRAHIIRCGAFLTLRGNDLDESSLTVEWIDISAQEYLEKSAEKELALNLKDMQHGIIALRCLEYIYAVTELYEAEESINDVEEEGTGIDAEAEETNDVAPHEESQVTGSEHEAEPGSPVPADGQDSDHAEDGIGNRDDDDDEPRTELAAPTDVASQADVEESNNIDDLQYMVKFWLEHAKLAPADVIEEFRIGHVFWSPESPPRQDWWSMNDPMHLLPNQTNVSALHVATIAEFPAFVDHLLNYGWTEDIHKEDSLGFQPLFYACATGNYEIVQTLLGAGADINYISPAEEDNVSALFAAADRGHLEIVECLLERDADINAKSAQYGSPLYVACEQNQEDIIRLLLSRDADVNLIGGPGRRPLNIAAWTGNLDVIRLLIEKGADIDPDEEYWYGSAVGSASRNGHADVVRFLLSKGWNPSKSMKTYGAFLTCAATYGHLSVVELLVQKEARITVLEQALAAASQNGKAAVVKVILEKTPTLRHQKAFMLAADYGRDEVLKLLFPRGMSQDKLDEALYVAADHENESTVRLLLEFGASPNAEGPIYGCALTASAYDGTEGIMKTLIENGADVNKRAGDYGMPLQAASWFGDVDNIKLLIEHGAIVNTEPIGIYGNALQAACETGDDDTIRLLIEEGANINAYGGKYDYPIIAAIDQADSDALKILLEHNVDVNVSGHSDGFLIPVIALAGATLTKEDLEAILDRGADVNASCEEGTTALINCAEAGDAEGIEFLLSRGANVHMTSEKWGSALHISAARGEQECCSVLLKANADVNAVGGPTGTPLSAAAEISDLETVRLLLEAGADATGLEIVAGEYGTPLQASCAAGDIEVVRLLIEHGAIIDLPANGKCGGPLSAACANGNLDIVELLLEHGADVHLKGGIDGYPILAAAASDTTSDAIIQMLLDHGADVSAQGGVYGSTVGAASFSNNAAVLQMLIDRGADPHAVGGKYGSPLVCASMKATDMSCIDILLKYVADINYRAGKYHTALIAASYFDKQDVVTKLLDTGADFRLSGGKFGSAISAAAMRGNKTILEKYLKMGPPEQLLDEALVEACAHRQSSSVELLLKSGANVYARHSSLGTPVEALKAEQAVGYNSDDEYEDNAEEDSDEEEDEDDEAEEDEEWEGDGESVAEASQQGSVTDLQLEDELSEEAKIQKLLDEAMARVKRNPSVKRFRTVRRGNLPASLKTGPPLQLTPRTSYQQFNPSANGSPYGQQYGQEVPNGPRQSFQAYPGPEQQAGNYPAQNYAPPAAPAYTPYRGSVGGPPPQPPQQQYPPTASLARKPVANGHGQSPPKQSSNPPTPLRQYSSGPNAGNPPPLPPRNGSQEQLSNSLSTHPPNRGPQFNPGSSGRYQQQQQRQQSYQGPQSGYQSPPQPGYNTPPGQNPYVSPPPSAYTSPPMYNSPPPPQQYGGPPQPQYQSPPPSQYQPLTSQPLGQESGYIAYGHQSQSSSQTSLQSSQYANSMQYGGSQQGPYSTSNSSQTSGFGSQGQGQGRRWNSGGYDGEGYG